MKWALSPPPRALLCIVNVCSVLKPFLFLSCLSLVCLFALCHYSFQFSVYFVLQLRYTYEMEEQKRGREIHRATLTELVCIAAAAMVHSWISSIYVFFFIICFFFSIFYLLYILLHTFASWFYFNLNLLFFLLFENVRNFLSSTLSIVFVSVSVSLSYTCSSQYSIKIHLRISNGIYLIVMDVKMCITCSR